MSFIFQYSWIVILVGHVFQTYMFAQKCKPFDTESERISEKVMKAYGGIGSIPWIIMGFGLVSGNANSFLEYLMPPTDNWAVVTFHASIWLIWAVLFHWVFFANGAEFIAKYKLITIRLFFEQRETTPKSVKLFTALAICGGIFGEYLIWTRYIIR